jgi:hypothetical protein
MLIKGIEGLLVKVSEEIIGENRFVCQYAIYRWKLSPGFPINNGRMCTGRWIYPNRFNFVNPKTDSEPMSKSVQIDFLLYSNRRM